MADNVNINDLNEEQLKNAVTSLLAQVRQSESAIKDLGIKVANKEIENSKLKSALEILQSQIQPSQPVEKATPEVVSEEEGAEEEAE